MAIDLDWRMLTDASANFGNALVNAASTIHDRRKEAGDREATANYLSNPNDPTAFQAAVRRNPGQALQIQEHHLEAARALRAEHQQQLDYIGQLLTGPDGTPIQTDAEYQQALGLARRAQIDTTGHETFDPNWVNGAVNLHQRLHPVAPVNVGRGDRLINPLTGQVIARGAAPPAQVVPLVPGGRAAIYNQPDPDAAPAATPAPQPAAPAEAASDIMHNPQTGETIRFNPQTNRWEPVSAAEINLQNWNGGGAAQPQASGTFPW